MLESTFIHLPGIGLKTEKGLWASGIYTWADFKQARREQPDLFDKNPKDRIRGALEESEAALANGDADYFAERLPSSEQYRTVLQFQTETGFLDIETTGLSSYYDHITVVGLWVAGEYRCFVQGDRPARLQEMFDGVKCLVTFNGSIFDLPFIRRHHAKITLPKAHLDLRFFARRFGLSGGQKQIEQELQLARDEGVAQVTGERAPLLWHDYRLGNLEALKQLIRYNWADVVGMQSILDAVLSRVQEPVSILPSFAQRSAFRDSVPSIAFAKSKTTSRRNRIFVTKYAGRRGPLVTYNDLQKFLPQDSAFRVVGIDLTGSEKRPTGWSLLEGSNAHTMRVHTDEQIIAETMQVKPNLVSIDSPLSLPKGRKEVSNNDPGRKEFGIIRQCERILKQRGVNVYPALIDSMQSLTDRGMRLASTLRSMGLPVIESYPGAAQDIMQIPRKRAGLDHLVKGLCDFGLRGAFTSEPISHDELDAITSAVVGLFFWVGRYEALGDTDEDYLIIPDLNADNSQWLRRRVIAFSGPIASGKTTAARYLESRGYRYVRFSQILEEELKALGRQANRLTLQELGERVNRKSGGQRWLASQVAQRLDDAEIATIDGVRFPEDYATLVEYFGPALMLVYIDCPANLRKDRYIAAKHSAKEYDNAILHHVETKVVALRDLAQSEVSNGSQIVGFHRRLNHALSP
ncbi:DUF429 domain-containing protein [bacterium]|nr:DUF429 domain-containing protein [bacterium]